MSGSGEYDAAFCKQQGFEQAAGNGYVTQLDDLLDFDKPWWDSKSLEGFSVLGKTLAVSGDVTFMDKLSYIVIYFNKPMADDYNLGDIYQMVIDKQWTFDKMLSMCGIVSADLNEDGKMDKEDRFGFAGQNDAGYEFYQSAGERFCTLDKDGVPYMSNDSERAIQIFTNIYTFMNDKTNFFNRSKANITVADAIEMFRSNRVLFMMRPLQDYNGASRYGRRFRYNTDADDGFDAERVLYLDRLHGRERSDDPGGREGSGCLGAGA